MCTMCTMFTNHHAHHMYHLYHVCPIYHVYHVEGRQQKVDHWRLTTEGRPKVNRGCESRLLFGVELHPIDDPFNVPQQTFYTLTSYTFISPINDPSESLSVGAVLPSSQMIFFTVCLVPGLSIMTEKVSCHKVGKTHISQQWCFKHEYNTVAVYLSL